MTAGKTSLKKWNRSFSFSIFIVIILSFLLCWMYTNSPGVEFLRTLSKLKKRKKILLLLVYILYKTWNWVFSCRSHVKLARMDKKLWCTCKVVVLLVKTIVFMTFLLLSLSSDLKVPFMISITGKKFRLQQLNRGNCLTIC